MVYYQILTHFLSVSIFTAGLVFLAKVVIGKIAEARLEKYKNVLQQDTVKFRNQLNFESERFKHDLNTSFMQHQIKYTRLYEERGEIIKLIYNSLLSLENSLKILTSKFQGPEWTTDTERDKITSACIEKLRNELEQNRIFFSEPLCKKIETILEDSHKISVEMFMAKQQAKRNDESNRRGVDLSEKELLNPGESWDKQNDNVQNNIKQARLDLAQEFRILIGVE